MSKASTGNAPLTNEGIRAGEWAARATALYDASYAHRYRAHDDTLDDSRPYLELVEWLQSVCARFAPGFDALDLGCGTGRYFWAVRNVRRLVGLDASSAMLDGAAHPVHAERIKAERVTLIEGDLVTHEFPPASFDLVYSIGVLAEHVPLDERTVSRVTQWLRPGGRFAFTTVHPDSPSIPRTWKRRVARGLVRLLPSPAAAPVRRRLLTGGLYADEACIEDLLGSRFRVEHHDRFISEAHLHCRYVARKVDARGV